MYVQFWNFAKEIYILKYWQKNPTKWVKEKPKQVKMTPFTWQLLILIKVQNFLKFF